MVFLGISETVPDAVFSHFSDQNAFGYGRNRHFHRQPREVPVLFLKPECYLNRDLGLSSLEHHPVSLYEQKSCVPRICGAVFQTEVRILF
jgi:hypothetical protein